MNTRPRHEIVIVDLIGELDIAMSARLGDEIAALECAGSATIVVRLERIASTQWAGLCELANVIAKHRRAGVDVRVHSRLQRVRTVLEEFAIPGDLPDDNGSLRRRRLIIARTPKPYAAVT